jgi:hypothetical protein
MAYGPSPDQYDMTPGHQWWTDNAPVDPNRGPVPDVPAGQPASQPPAQQPQQPPQYGGPYAQIAQWFKRYTGRDPSDAEVRQWGTNLDANYLAKIENSIKTLGANSGYWDLSTNAPKATGPTSPASGPKPDWWDPADPQGSFQKLVNGHAPTPSELAALEPELKKAGIEIVRNAAGVAGKIKLPGGQIVDVIQSAGTGGKAWQWLTGSADGNDQPSNLLDPFPERFQSKPLKTPDPFKAPSSDEAFNDQGFQFTLKQGKDALQKSAAANGTLLTTGTLQDLDSFSQGLASEQYDKVYNRKLGEYENNYGHIQTNYDRDRSNALQEYGLRHDLYNEAQDRPFTKLYQLSSLGTGGPGGSSYANGMSNTLTGIGNAQAASGLYGANAWQNGFGSLANLGGYYMGQYANRNSYSPYGPYASGYRY